MTMLRLLNVQIVEVHALQAAVDALASGGATDLKGVAQNWDEILPANDPGGACPANSSRFTLCDGLGGRAGQRDGARVGTITGDVLYTGKTFSAKVWCVRGGMNADQY